MEIDSNFFSTPSGVLIEKSEDGDIAFYSDEEMMRFPESLFFKKASE